ncbi:hypothetical protein F4778DRAFT_595693 [Xylariomycetidae sp. FL2044]|nr:hypothetical protein F4778DRAFT_595693 [Xylariomycetidae sp. FL2044]
MWMAVYGPAGAPRALVWLVFHLRALKLAWSLSSVSLANLEPPRRQAKPPPPSSWTYAANRSCALAFVIPQNMQRSVSQSVSQSRGDREQGAGSKQQGSRHCSPPPGTECRQKAFYICAVEAQLPLSVYRIVARCVLAVALLIIHIRLQSVCLST